MTDSEPVGSNYPGLQHVLPSLLIGAVLLIALLWGIALLNRI